ncbi:hypothetical protein [Bartonella sp. B17]
MYLFSSHLQNVTTKKRIAQFKNKFLPMNRWHSHNNNLDMREIWKKKCSHTLYSLSKQGTKLKKKVTENPKTAFALVTGMALAGFFLTRKD